MIQALSVANSSGFRELQRSFKWATVGREPRVQEANLMLVKAVCMLPSPSAVPCALGIFPVR